MSFWIWADGGLSLPAKKTWGQKLGVWWGRRLALRHKKVSVSATAVLSPEARIHPREGAIVIGDNCVAGPGAIIQGNVRMGSNCSVQAYSILVGYGNETASEGVIRLGDNVRIASHCMLIAGNHNFSDISRPIARQGLTHKSITIEDDVWIGGRVNITAGVTVGRGSVIGAGAVVTRDIPPYSVAVGTPARVIKKRV